MTDETEITSLKVDVGIIKAQMVDMKGQNDRIENKLDGMTFASVTDVAEAKTALEAFRQEVKKTFATIEYVKPVVNSFWKFVYIIGTALVLALLGLVLKR